MPLAQRTLGCGVFTAGMQIGAIIASWSVGVLILEFDWRWIFVAFSMPGILWALGFVSWFRERP
jgi:MFS family permease